MRRFITCFFFITSIYFGFGNSSFQSSPYMLEEFCSNGNKISFHSSAYRRIYVRVPKGSMRYGYDASPRSFQDIARYIGVSSSSFHVLEAESGVDNAMAIMCDQERYILYNPDYLNDINDRTGTGWADMVVLAHEIGHHLQGHTLRSIRSNPQIELEADEFAGFVLFNMGASIEDLQMAYSGMSDYGSATHPGRLARIEAITRGWSKADSLQLNVRPN